MPGTTLSTATTVLAAQIAERVDRIRRAGRGEPWSNYFFAELWSTEAPIWETPSTLVFLDREHDFHRVYFVTHAPAELGEILGAIREPALVADHLIMRREEPEVADAFRGAGFTNAARYRRMTLRRPRRAASRPAAAEAGEADALYTRLCEDFDRKLDRIPTREQFADWVHRGWVLVHRREGGESDGYLIYRLQGRRADWDYWSTSPDSHRGVAVKLLSDFFTDMARREVATIRLWVQESKSNERKVYERLGFRPDGMVRDTYIR